MKNFKFILIILFSVLFLYSCGKKSSNVKTEGESSSEKTTGTEEISPNSSFMVTYDIKGSEMTGTAKSYIANKKLRMDDNFQVAGQKMTSEVISDGEWVYIISEAAGQKVGMKMNTKKYSEQQEKKGSFDMANFQDMLKKYQKTGTEVIIGKECNVYKVNDKTTIAVYKDIIPLKIDEDNGRMIMVASSYEVNPKLPDDFFTPPSGIDYKEF